MPLVSAAVTILEEIRGEGIIDPDPLIFPGLMGTMSDAALAKMLRVHGGGDYSVDGFRSAFRDWAAEKADEKTLAERAEQPRAITWGVADQSLPSIGWRQIRSAERSVETNASASAVAIQE